ncbi:MAG: hypothetical protein OEX19_11965 [Gammaproteobacteria bacterium]|nr:hypothetical protein [Gammaproteobacteria bacterium]
MNNTFNYSFLIENKYGEFHQYKNFIPSHIIASKYINPNKPGESRMTQKKADASITKSK